MASSGTYAFAPSVADLVVNCYGRCKIRRDQLTAAHMADARMETNLLLQDWGTKGVNLWTVELETQVLTAGQAAYTLDASTLTVLDAYISTGSDPATDRIIMPVSRSDYAAYPDKETEGVPTVWWLDRQIVPILTLWQPPDDEDTYTLKYYRMRQVQDANLAGGETPNLPNRFLEAFATDLSHRLARIWADAEIEAARKADALEAWYRAAGDDVENVPISIIPQTGSYFR